MLKIRLRRMGAKKAPFYRIVVSDSRSVPTGPFVDVVGHYNPGTEPVQIKLDVERAEEWIRKGALPSETVKRLIHKVRTAVA